MSVISRIREYVFGKSLRTKEKEIATSVDQLIAKCRTQETSIVDLLIRQDLYVSAAVELCSDFQARDEQGHSLDSSEAFIGFAKRRGETLGLAAVRQVSGDGAS